MDAFESGLVWLAPTGQAELIADALSAEGLQPRQRRAAPHRGGAENMVISATIETLTRPTSREAHDALQRSVATIERIVNCLPEDLIERDGSIRLSIMWGLDPDENSGLALGINEIQRLAELGCALWLDIYDGSYSSSRTSLGRRTWAPTRSSVREELPEGAAPAIGAARNSGTPSSYNRFGKPPSRARPPGCRSRKANLPLTDDDSRRAEQPDVRALDAFGAAEADGVNPGEHAAVPVRLVLRRVGGGLQPRRALSGAARLP